MTRLGLLIAGGVLATGCMKSDGSITAAQAQNAGDALGTGIEDSAKGFGPMNASASADAPCVVLSGDTADTDQDNIPANARLTFNCTALALGYTGTLTGTETVMDDMPTAAWWAFTGAADLHATLTGPFGGTIVRDWSGELKGTQATVGGPFATARTVSVTTVFTPPGAHAHATTVTEDNDWAVTFTPMATWTPGGVAVTGSLWATGTWNATVDGLEIAASLSTPTPVKLDPTCATRATAGQVRGTYGVGATMRSITVTWTGCGARTVVFGS